MQSTLPAILRQANLINLAQEQMVIEQINASGLSAPEALLSLGLFDSQKLTQHLEQLLSQSCVQLSHYHYADVCQQLSLRDLICRLNALPLEKDDLHLTVAVTDPSYLAIEEEFRFATGLRVELVLADYDELKGAIRRLYGRSSKVYNAHKRDIHQDELAQLVELSADEVDQVEDLSLDDAPVSRYINQILLEAVRKGASDIHFEPYETSYRVRFRCDGILVEIQTPPHHLSRRLAARIKILAKLDIAERRLPQDGRIKIKIDQLTSIDIRVSSLPTLWGEKMVLRILDSHPKSLEIDALGYTKKQRALYLSALKKPQGMILMTGPTGSGKTVSLYAGLHQLNTPDVNIATAEDPIEINLSGINQTQVQPQIGFSFAQALRAFLRQDPDIIMVGEIRDFETAEIAVKAAQTGHLVLSTLHTNSAAESVVRLANMGIEAFNIASSLSLIIAQRLARRLCPLCKVKYQVTEAQRQQLKLSPSTFIYQANPTGCHQCNNGYSGRTGIYEVMTFSDKLSQAIAQGANAQQIESLAQKEGMATLHESGIEKLLKGITSFQELQRVLYL